MDLPFYVYALVDPRDGRVFYIGKGKGRRMYQHENDVRRGKIVNATKCARIIEILAAGLRVACEVLHRFASEQAAYEAERTAIKRHAELTNANGGGGGSWSGTQGSGDERQESPALSMRKALDLIRRLVPFDAWSKERQRTPEEVGSYHAIVGDLVDIVVMCQNKLQTGTGSRRDGRLCPV